MDNINRICEELRSAIVLKEKLRNQLIEFLTNNIDHPSIDRFIKKKIINSELEKIHNGTLIDCARHLYLKMGVEQKK